MEIIDVNLFIGILVTAYKLANIACGATIDIATSYATFNAPNFLNTIIANTIVIILTIDIGKIYGFIILLSLTFDIWTIFISVN